MSISVIQAYLDLAKDAGELSGAQRIARLAMELEHNFPDHAPSVSEDIIAVIEALIEDAISPFEGALEITSEALARRVCIAMSLLKDQPHQIACPLSPVSQNDSQQP